MSDPDTPGGGHPPPRGTNKKTAGDSDPPPVDLDAVAPRRSISQDVGPDAGVELSEGPEHPEHDGPIGVAPEADDGFDSDGIDFDEQPGFDEFDEEADFDEFEALDEQSGPVPHPGPRLALPPKHEPGQHPAPPHEHGPGPKKHAPAAKKAPGKKLPAKKLPGPKKHPGAGREHGPGHHPVPPHEHGPGKPRAQPNFGLGPGTGFGSGPFPGFGLGYGFGQPGSGVRHGSGAGRRGRPGDVRAAIITLLAERPMHGYEMIKEIAERSQGSWRPSPGSVYPTLQMLDDEGLIGGSESAGKKRLFELTQQGRTAAAKIAVPPWEQMAQSADHGGVNLRAALVQVVAAVTQSAYVATAEQQQRIVALLKKVRREIYAMLAESG